MRFPFAARVALAVALAHASAAADPLPVRLPPGSRTDAAGQLVSSRGLRDTTDAITKDLARQGIATKQIGPYRVRGVELTRFLSESPTTTWLAIHVARIAGKTMIFVVARPTP